MTHDLKGIPFYPGDLVKHYHYTGARNKKYYMYHVIANVDGILYAIPTSHLEPTRVKGGGQVPLKWANFAEPEIISGHGPEPYLTYEERPRIDVA
jgi:hypothetical protein